MSEQPSSEQGAICPDCRKLPSDEWPQAAAMIAEIVRYAGTQWVRDICDEIESGCSDD